MKRTFLASGVLATAWTVGMVSSGFGWAQEEKDLQGATVELVVRSPDGRPVAKAEVEIASGLHAFRDETPSSITKKNRRGGACSLLLVYRPTAADRDGQGRRLRRDRPLRGNPRDNRSPGTAAAGPVWLDRRCRRQRFASCGKLRRDLEDAPPNGRRHGTKQGGLPPKISRPTNTLCRLAPTNAMYEAKWRLPFSPASARGR